jgi:putative endonuclease
MKHHASTSWQAASRGALYTGVTANLPRRAFEHQLHDSMIEAIRREKQIKAGSRAKKLA